MASLLTNNDKGLRCCNKRSLSLEEFLSFDKPCKDDFVSIRKRSRRGIISTWNVNMLPTIPNYYIKEKTSVAVINSKPQCVADRIVQCAKNLLADYVYNDQKAEATLTINETKLCVQLFIAASRTPSTIVVEIRRKTGSPITFHKVARVILSAAKGDPIAFAPSLIISSLPSRTENKLVFVTASNGEDETKRGMVGCDEGVTAAGTIGKIDTLLKKDRVDANLLGMESLLNLTTSGSSSKKMALFTAGIILNGGNSNDVIKDMVFSLIRHSSTNNDDDANNIVEDGYKQRMRICALSLFANSLEVLSISDLESKLSDDWVGDDGILPSLVDILKDSEASLQEAYFAAKCLKMLFEASLDLRSWAMEQEVFKIVKHSQNVGHCTHNLLGCTSDDILLCLGKGVATKG